MAFYTEQQIRGLAINFLRFHYKLRPRYAGGGTRIVDKPHYYQGVLIDARMAYQQPDQTYFTATIEATSVNKREEILYETNYWRVVIHAFVLTLAVGALLIWGLTLLPADALGGDAGAVIEESILLPAELVQRQGFNLWRAFGTPRIYGVLVAGFLLTFGTIGVLLSRWRVYRYIYAVDQFKHFYADAQWIAYDVNIFDETSWRSRRRYRELHRQCVQWGFGMLAVEADRVVKVVITPSQVDQFGGNRIKLPKWIANVEGAPIPRIGVFRKRKTAPKKAPLPPPEEVTDPLDVGTYLDLPAREVDQLPVAYAKPGKPKFYERPDRQWKRLRARLRRSYRRIYPGGLRRRPGYYELGGWVFFVGFISLVAVTAGLLIQSNYEPVARVGDRGAVPDLTQLENPDNPAPFNEIEEGEYQRTVNNAGPDPEAQTNVPENAIVESEVVTEDEGEIHRIRFAAAGDAQVDYACVPLYTLEKGTYLLVAGRFTALGPARARAEQLNRRYRIPVAVAQNACVSPGPAGYILYLEAPTDDEGEINFLARKYLREYDLAVEVLEIPGT